MSLMNHPEMYQRTPVAGPLTHVAVILVDDSVGSAHGGDLLRAVRGTRERTVISFPQRQFGNCKKGRKKMGWRKMFSFCSSVLNPQGVGERLRAFYATRMLFHVTAK